MYAAVCGVEESDVTEWLNWTESESRSVMSDSLWPRGTPWTIQSMEFSRPEYWGGWPFPSPGDRPNPGIEPRSLHCRQILYQLSHQRSPRILECVAYPFSSGTSRPRNWTGVSCIAGGVFTNWTTRELKGSKMHCNNNNFIIIIFY